MLNIEDILRFLPHRYPFLLVDRVLEMEKEKRIVALKNVTYNEEFFQGHFPDIRIMPGVLIVEAMAQAGGILLFHSIPEPGKEIRPVQQDRRHEIPPARSSPETRSGSKPRCSRSRTGSTISTRRPSSTGEIAAEGDMVASMLEREEFYGRK